MVGSGQRDKTARAKVWVTALMELLPKGTVLGSLFERSHIYYLLVITHLKSNFLDFTYYSTGAVTVLIPLQSCERHPLFSFTCMRAHSDDLWRPVTLICNTLDQ